MTDQVTAAMFEVSKDHQIAKLRDAALAERARANRAEELANLYGGIVAVVLDGMGEAEFGVHHEQVIAVVTRRGMLGVRVTPEGVIAHWTADPTVTDAGPLPKLALVSA